MYEFLEDGVTSDITFRLSAPTLEELFSDAALALLNTMVDPIDTVGTGTAVRVSVSSAELDLLLMDFLNDLIFRKDAHGMLLRPHSITITHAGGRYLLEAEMRGEAIDTARHALRADVKAVTLHGLHVTREDGGWRAQVTVDV